MPGNVPLSPCQAVNANTAALQMGPCTTCRCTACSAFLCDGTMCEIGWGLPVGSDPQTQGANKQGGTFPYCGDEGHP